MPSNQGQNENSAGGSDRERPRHQEPECITAIQSSCFPPQALVESVQTPFLITMPSTSTMMSQAPADPSFVIQPQPRAALHCSDHRGSLSSDDSEYPTALQQPERTRISQPAPRRPPNRQGRTFTGRTLTAEESSEYDDDDDDYTSNEKLLRMSKKLRSTCNDLERIRHMVTALERQNDARHTRPWNDVEESHAQVSSLLEVRTRNIYSYMRGLTDDVKELHRRLSAYVGPDEERRRASGAVGRGSDEHGVAVDGEGWKEQSTDTGEVQQKRQGGYSPRPRNHPPSPRTPGSEGKQPRVESDFESEETRELRHRASGRESPASKFSDYSSDA